MKKFDLKELKYLYYDKKMSGHAIAKLFKVTPTILYKRMADNQMPRRTYTEAHRLRHSGTKRHTKSAEVIRLYFDEKLSLQKVADRVGLTPPSVRRFILEAGLTPRKRNETSRKGTSRFTPADRLEIKRLYCEEKLSCQEIAPKFESSSVAIQINLEKEGVARRSYAEAQTNRQEKKLAKSRNQHQKSISKQLENLPELTPKEITPTRILNLRYEDNLTLDAIARLCSLTTVEIFNILESKTITTQ